MLSIDLTDISGEHVRDLSYNIRKVRLDEKGDLIAGGKILSGSFIFIILAPQSLTIV